MNLQIFTYMQQIYLLREASDDNQNEFLPGITLEQTESGAALTGSDLNPNSDNYNYYGRNNYNLNELLQQQQLEQNNKRSGRRISAFVPMRGRRSNQLAATSDKSGNILRNILVANGAQIAPLNTLISAPRSFGSSSSSGVGGGASGLRNILNFRSSSSGLMEPAKLRRAFHPMRGKRNQLQEAEFFSNQGPINDDVEAKIRGD